VSAADLPGLRADYPGWQIDHHTTAAGDYFAAVLPGRVVKVSDAKRLREQLGDHTGRAVAALADAAAAEPDFGGWLAAALTTVAGQLGSPAKLVAARPGGWEAELVLRLVHGTVVDDDEAEPGV
jgi:hypothetical protein